jgi:hypothetical protein
MYRLDPIQYTPPAKPHSTSLVQEYPHFKSSDGISGSEGLKDMVLVQRLDEIGHIGAHHFPARPIASADLVGDARLVIPLLHEFEDLGPDNIQAKHLAVMDVEENSSVHCLSLPNCVGYAEHCLAS